MEKKDYEFSGKISIVDNENENMKYNATKVKKAKSKDKIEKENKQNEIKKRAELEIFISSINEFNSMYPFKNFEVYKNAVLERTKLTPPPDSFYEMLERTVEVLKLIGEKNGGLPKDFDVRANMPKDLYEAYGCKPEYSWLKGCKTLSECKHPKFLKVKESLIKLHKWDNFMDESVDIDLLKRMKENRGIDIRYICDDIISSFKINGNINSSNGILNNSNEVGDGQHRIIGLIILGKPFKFTRDSRLNIEKVRGINQKSLGWTQISLLKSESESGKLPYDLAYKLYTRYCCSNSKYNSNKSENKYRKLPVSAMWVAIANKSRANNNWFATGSKRTPMVFTVNRYTQVSYILDTIIVKYYGYFINNENEYKDKSNLRDDAMVWLLIYLHWVSKITKHLKDVDYFDMDKFYQVIYKGSELDKNKRPKIDLHQYKDYLGWCDLLLDAYFKNEPQAVRTQKVGTIKGLFDSVRSCKCDGIIEHLEDEDLGMFSLAELETIDCELKMKDNKTR